VFVRTNAPDVVRGLFVGLVDEEPTAATLQSFGIDPDSDRTRDVALVDPATDVVRGRFTSAVRVSGCVAMGEDRVLYVEGDALVSRTIDGGDRRVHVTGVLREREVLSGSLLCTGACAALLVRESPELAADEDPADDFDSFIYHLRIFDVRVGELLRSIERIGYVSLVQLTDDALLYSQVDSDDTADPVFSLLDLKSGATRWNARRAQWFADDVFELRDFDAGRTVLSSNLRDTAAIDAATGALRWSRKEVSCVATDGNGVALMARGAHALEARRIDDGSLVARWRIDAPIESGTCLSVGRFAVFTARSLHLFELDPSSPIIDLPLEQGRSTLFGRLVGSRGWLCVSLYCGSIQIPPDAQLPAVRCTRLLASEQDEPVLLYVPSELSERKQTNDQVGPPIDRERIEAILTIHREEDGDERAAWERLVARSLVDPEFDTDRCPVTISADRYRMGEHRATGDRGAVWLAFAHDQRTLATAAALASELCERLAPWCNGRAPGWCFETNDLPLFSKREPVMRRLVETITRCVRFVGERRGETAIDADYGRLEPLARELDYLWKFAVDRDMTMPDSAPRGVAGRPFRELRSPLEPLLSLYAIDFGPGKIDELLLMRLWRIDAETGRRMVPTSEDEDIPF
jgi:hypothetical protein